MKWTVELSPKDQPWLDAVRMMDRSDAVLWPNEVANRPPYIAKNAFCFFYSLQKIFLKSVMMSFSESIFVSGKQ